MSKVKAMKVGASDEFYTPEYVVEIFKKYIPKEIKTILLPFDKEWSSFVKVLSKDYEVTYSHKEERDFFDYKEELKDYDLIISNPPFSIKDKILKELYNHNCKFMMLLPLTTLEGITRSRLYRENNISVVVFDKRVDYMNKGSSPYFNTSIFTNIYEENKLIFEEVLKEK